MDCTEVREYSIKKRMSSLQWDLSMVTNDEVREIKQAELKILQSELQGLKPN
ncbi:hypothetical protein ACFL0V_02005 [Nanoarchaeota archaeon]